MKQQLFFIFIPFILCGCSLLGGPKGQVATNKQTSTLQLSIVQELTRLEIAKITANKAIRLAEIAQQSPPERKASPLPLPDASRCEEYRDMDFQTGSVQAAPEISGSHNNIIIGSPGAEVNHGGGVDHGTDITGALVGFLYKTPFISLPQQPSPPDVAPVPQPEPPITTKTTIPIETE